MEWVLTLKTREMGKKEVVITDPVDIRVYRLVPVGESNEWTERWMSKTMSKTDWELWLEEQETNRSRTKR